MTYLALGLVLFLGVHSVRMVADGWRSGMLARLGENGWKGLYSLVSLAGFVLIVWGYGVARQQPIVLWAPPGWTRSIAGLLMMASLVLIVAAYVPGNHFKARIGHPMLAGTKTWAFAHLIANQTLADVLLFGGFFVWALLCFRSARARDRAAGVSYRAGRAGPTIATTALGLGLWAFFAFYAHGAWFGARLFG
jgi:uncharacterized membrane protein